MATDTTYSHLRQNLATMLDRVVDDQEVVIVRRKRNRDVALIPAHELASLMETAYLLRSPTNAAVCEPRLEAQSTGAVRRSPWMPWRAGWALRKVVERETVPPSSWRILPGG